MCIIVRLMASLSVLFLRGVYFFYKLVLKPKEKITMLTRQSNKPTMDFTMLESALIREGFSGQIVILAKKIEKPLLSRIQYGLHILRQMYHIATSKIVLVDGYCIPVCVLNHKEGQSFIQIWHALNIVKKFGYLALDKPWGHSSATAKSMCMHRNYTHIVASAKQTGEILLGSFNAAPDKLVILGLPRIDYITGLKGSDSAKLRNAYPDVFSKKLILYAPTFRKGKKVDLSWITKTIDLDEYNVVVKLHPSDVMGIDEITDDRIVYDTKFKSFDWMVACDKLITDYSGIGLEATLLDKPIYFFLYDYEEYKDSNGLNIDLYSEEISRYVTNSADKLKAMLESEYDYSVIESYRNKYLDVDINDCSGEFARYIIGMAGNKDGTKRDSAGDTRTATVGASNSSGR